MKVFAYILSASSYWSLRENVVPSVFPFETVTPAKKPINVELLEFPEVK